MGSSCNRFREETKVKPEHVPHEKKGEQLSLQSEDFNGIVLETSIESLQLSITPHGTFASTNTWKDNMRHHSFIRQR